MRLIDADCLFQGWSMPRGSCELRIAARYCQAIKDAPTIDAVPVVRCKDCRHWRDDNPRANGYHCCYRMHNIFPMKESDFCSRGERRTDETD